MAIAQLPTPTGPELQPVPTVRFIVGSGQESKEFIISKHAVFAMAPNFKWVFTESGSIVSATGVMVLQHVEPAIFQYLADFFNTSLMQSVDEKADGALVTLAKIWVLAEYSGNKNLQNAVMVALHRVLSTSPAIQDFLHYAYSLPPPSTNIKSEEDVKLEAQFQKQQDPHIATMVGLRNCQVAVGYTTAAKGEEDIGGKEKHTLKRLAIQRVVWTFTKETLSLVRG
jgi:hypothetical protein